MLLHWYTVRYRAVWYYIDTLRDRAVYYYINTLRYIAV